MLPSFCHSKPLTSSPAAASTATSSAHLRGTSQKLPAPTLGTDVSSLPPEGAVLPWGGPAAKPAPTLGTDVSSLPPEGAVLPWGGPAAKPAPTLGTDVSSLPPEGAVLPWGGPAAKPAPTLGTDVSSLPPEGAELGLGGPSLRSGADVCSGAGGWGRSGWLSLMNQVILSSPVCP